MTQTTERPAPRPASGAGGRGGASGPLGRAVLFYRQVVAELRKVIWPTRSELVTYTLVALVFVTAMIALVAAFDYVFTKGVLNIFG